MRNQNKSPKTDLKQRVESLEEELLAQRQSERIKDSIIIEYREALSEAQFKIAILNGRLKQTIQPTA